MKIANIILILFALSYHLHLSADSDSDRENILKGYTGHSTSIYCSSKTYMNCLWITKASCEQAIKISTDNCVSSELVEALNYDESKNEKSALQTIRSESNEYSVCLLKMFTEKLSLTDKQMEKCSPHLETVLMDYYEAVKREHELLKKEIEKSD